MTKRVLHRTDITGNWLGLLVLKNRCKGCDVYRSHVVRWRKKRPRGWFFLIGISTLIWIPFPSVLSCCWSGDGKVSVL